MNVFVELFWTLCHVLETVLWGVIYAILPQSYKDLKNVSGDVALITGAGSGIGRLMCFEFAKRGAVIVALDIDKDANNETKEMIEKKGGVAHAYECNVGDKDAVYKVAARVKQDVGAVDFLVNNAGVVSGETMLNLSDAQIERTMNVNLLSNFWTVKAFLPDMMERRSGHVVTIASVAGLIGSNKMTDYCASKFGAVGFAESLEVELRAGGYDNIYTTTVCPYIIDTGMFDGCQTKFPKILGILEPKQTVKRIMQAIYTNQKIVYIPRSMYLLALLKHLLPVDASYALSSFFGGTDLMKHFKGRQRKE